MIRQNKKTRLANDKTINEFKANSTQFRLEDSGFPIRINLFQAKCPNCNQIHKLEFDSERIGSYVMCRNFSRPMSYKYPRGRAYIINFFK